MNKKQDERLSNFLIKGQQGCADSYKIFLLEVSMLLRAFLLNKTNSSSDAEDILQETLLSIHQARHTYSPGRPVGPWIYAICENRIIDGARKQSRGERLKKAWALEQNNESIFQADSGYLSERVFELMKSLPQKQKQIIELLKLQGLSVSEISTKTGMSESAIKVAAFRGYETIRKLLGVIKNENRISDS